VGEDEREGDVFLKALANSKESWRLNTGRQNQAQRKNLVRIQTKRHGGVIVSSTKPLTEQQLSTGRITSIKEPQNVTE
jgi:hypothetical protein